MQKKFKGTVRERKGRYQAIYPYKDQTGKWKQLSKTSETEGQAYTWLKEMYADDKSHSLVVENPTLEVISERWMKLKTLSTKNKNSLSQFGYNTIVILARLNKRINDITDDDIVELFLKLREDGYEPAAYKNQLSAWYTFAIQRGLTNINRVKGIRVERTNKERPAIVLSDAQKQQLYIFTHGTKWMMLYYPIFFNLRNGLRIGELQGLRWSDVDMEKRCYSITHQITHLGEYTDQLKSDNAYRTNYMDPDTYELLKELKASPYTDFLHVFYEPYKLRGRIWYNLGKFGMCSHDLRHTHGTELQDLMPIADAAYRMGHTKEEYVKDYIHPRTEKTKEMMQKYTSPDYSDKLTDKQDSNVIQFPRRNA